MSVNLGPEIKSPCQLICQMDLKSELCAGCGRTREEIAKWRRYSDAEREVIIAGLGKRLEEAGLG